MINLFQPSVGVDEVRALSEVIESGWLGDGPRARAFESAFGNYIGRPGSELLGVTSCTEALFQVVAGLGLGPGDEVVLPSISFIGAAHAVRSTGARVVMCDVDPRTLNPTPAHVEEAITPATRALLILHYGGLPGDVLELAALARERSVLLIEDAACSLGSWRAGEACGTFGDVGVWSFDAAKVVTTGDGGMIWCRSHELAERLRHAIRLGVSASGFARSRDSGRWWEIDPPDIGRRATMNDLSAAIGLTQLSSLEAFVRRRAEVAATYNGALEHLPWLALPAPRPPEEAYFFYPVQLDPAARDQLALHLLERGIYTNFKYWPLHRTALYRSTASLPGSDRAAASTLLLPVHQGLSDSDVEQVVEAVRDFPVSASSRE